MVTFAIKKADGDPFPAPLKGLVDSGADGTIFPMGAMKPLGIDLADCEKKKQMGAGGLGEYYDGQGKTLEADFNGTTVQLQANFSDTPFILLGREDFFVHFTVTFEQRRLRFILES